MAIAKLYIMANDTKWLENEIDLNFTPFPGLNLEGLVDDEPLKINTMSYDVAQKCFKLRLAWLTITPLQSKELVALNVGWKLKK